MSTRLLIDIRRINLDDRETQVTRSVFRCRNGNDLMDTTRTAARYFGAEFTTAFEYIGGEVNPMPEAASSNYLEHSMDSTEFNGTESSMVTGSSTIGSSIEIKMTSGDNIV